MRRTAPQQLPAVLLLLSCAAALRVPAVPARPSRTRLHHGRVATAERIERPLLNAVRRPWKIPGHVAGRLNPALADWTSSHLLASPTQKILAGVSADQKACLLYTSPSPRD